MHSNALSFFILSFENHFRPVSKHTDKKTTYWLGRSPTNDRPNECASLSVDTLLNEVTYDLAPLDPAAPVITGLESGNVVVVESTW